MIFGYWQYLWNEKIADTKLDYGKVDDAVNLLLGKTDDLCCFVRNSLHPYNRIKIESLDKSYSDPREVMLHANFQILKDFVEKEKPLEFINWESDEHHSHASQEIRELYDWWVNVYPNRIDPYSEEFEGQEYEEEPDFIGLVRIPDTDTYRMAKQTPEYEKYLERCKKEEERQEAEEQEMVERLVKIRFYLWT